ncbi:MAG: DNA pilot protein [Arizlama microvirus]|nr:MAG: DNA pilot protein [Arizlama microvirus]
MASKKRQRGWIQFAAALGAAYLGQKGAEETNEANQGINSAQMAFNAEEAAKNRDFQRGMRETQYQTAVGDMRKAGLNPMLAYQQGGAGTPQGSTAQAGGLRPMANEQQAGITNAMTVAQLKNINAQTEVANKTADKIAAEIPMTVANTGRIGQETTNLKTGLEKLTEEVKNVRMDTLNKEEQVTLTRAQQQLVNVQKELTRGNITYVQAQEAVARVEAELKRYATAGAKNEAAFETKMGEGVGTGAKSINWILQLLKGLTGK